MLTSINQEHINGGLNLSDILLTMKSRNRTIQKKCHAVHGGLHKQSYGGIPVPAQQSISTYIFSGKTALWSFASLQVSFSFLMPKLIAF